MDLVGSDKGHFITRSISKGISTLREFELVSSFQPRGDQPQSIKALIEGVKKGVKCQTLLGITGSGKTYTIASVIEQVQRPILVISHNKTLAAQLYTEFKNFFPKNAVEYFVSYYDYYQPEAYLPVTDTYIDKDTSINEEIEKLRLSTTTSLLSRRDVIVIASVSCIYGLGSPEYFREMTVALKKGQNISIRLIMKKLTQIQYERADIDFKPGKIRVKGDVIDIFPSYSNAVIRVELFGDEIERLSTIDSLNATTLQEEESVLIYPAKHFVTPQEIMTNVVNEIENELDERVKFFKSQGRLLEAKRLKTRTKYDIEMLKETGYCKGIENYSLYFDDRKRGTPPYTLIDYFPKDLLMIIDESHMTIPQVKGMYEGDRSRKNSLVEYGFRIPCAYDNRPLTFKEFQSHINQVIYISASPAEYELKKSDGHIVEQVIRPTGLLDPQITVKPVKGQVDNLLSEIGKVTRRRERVLVTTLTKRMSEELTDYLVDAGVKARYLHSEIDTLERTEIIRDLRKGEFDVLVGINLLREGLDLPEVSLVAILDADKEGFLRTERSLIQTIGRASRNVNGHVIMYADSVTGAMHKAINMTNRHRKKQIQHNKKNNIVPATIVKDVQDLLRRVKIFSTGQRRAFPVIEECNEEELELMLTKLEQEMEEAAKKWEFERAAMIRDEILRIKGDRMPVNKDITLQTSRA